MDGADPEFYPRNAQKNLRGFENLGGLVEQESVISGFSLKVKNIVWQN